ncbi:hypothetical protein RA307_14010 [Xanthobacteraceae bacterium Astr-EGSB]|uniref:hypothetical protein n=1 Tax=Astrobacterium formosum TaxID=3069710 RepID=UPI0027B7415A|nr:hypothetical protein [Xanthobacteraceae bacterium Astr-EGSB]
MPFTVVQGTYHVVRYSPDGDSIRFQPASPALLDDLDGPPARINARGHVQLRIEAIDALETHYNPPSGGGTYHQPVVLADEARTRLLDFVGIRDVVWNTNRSNVVSATDGTPGHILTRTVEKNGRPVAFVFVGDPPADDGSNVHLDEAILRRSFNYLSLAEGLAYPTYYRGLFNDLRNVLTAAAMEARAARRGIHAKDATTTGFDADSIAVLTEQATILPKLFRRLITYVVSHGTAAGFKDTLELSREPVLHIPTGNFTHFDTFIEEKGSRIRMTCEPDELVFDEMATRPTAAFGWFMDERTAAKTPPWQTREEIARVFGDNSWT